MFNWLWNWSTTCNSITSFRLAFSNWLYSYTCWFIILIYKIINTNKIIKKLLLIILLFGGFMTVVVKKVPRWMRGFVKIFFGIKETKD